MTEIRRLMPLLAVVLWTVGVGAGLAAAQGGTAPQGPLLPLALRADVGGELGLTAEQRQKLLQLRTKTSRERERLNSPPAEGGEKPRERREKLRQLGAATQKEVEAILQPGQNARLKQIALRMRMRGGLVQELSTGAIAKELEITNDQRKELRKRARSLEAQRRERLAELDKQFEEGLTTVLTPSQREKFGRLLGEPFLPVAGGGRRGRDAPSASGPPPATQN